MKKIIPMKEGKLMVKYLNRSPLTFFSFYCVVAEDQEI
jgi:hypothetical protein